MEKKVWNTFDKAKGGFSSTGEAYKIFLMVCTVKYVEESNFEQLPTHFSLKGLLKNPDSIKIEFQKTLYFLETQIPFLDSVFSSLDIRWDFISDKSLYELLSSIDSWDISSYKDLNLSLRSWKEIHDGRFSYTTPLSLLRFIVEILKIEPKKTFYDGTAGIGGLLLAANSSCSDLELFGQEINLETWAIGKLHLYMAGLTNVKFNNGDTLIEPAFIEGKQVKKFDYLAMNPPFGAGMSEYQKEVLEKDIYKRFYYGEVPKKSLDFAFIQHALASLNDSGRGVLVISNGPLTRGTKEMEIRQKIVRSDQVEAIISLGSNALDYASIPTNLIILNKNKPNHKVGKIQFIQAKDFYIHTQRKKNDLPEHSIKEIVRILDEALEIEGVSKLISIDDIQPETLSVDAYLQENFVKIDEQYYQLKLERFNDQKNLKSLGEIATVYRGYNAIPKIIEESVEGQYKLIRTPDVEDNQLILDSVQTVNINSSFNEEQYLVEPGDIIISARGQHTKVAVIPELSGKFILTQSFIGIRPDKETVDSYFLKAFFESPIGQYLIQQSMSGSTIPVINPKLLNTLNIPLHSLQEQKKIGADYRKAMEEYRSTIVEARKQLENKRLNTYEEIGISKLFEIKKDK